MWRFLENCRGWYHPGAVRSSVVLLWYCVQTGELEMSSADAAEYEQVRRCVYGCCPRCDCGPLQQCCQGFCRCSVVTGAGAQGLGTGAAATECHRAQCDGAWLCVPLGTRLIDVGLSGNSHTPWYVFACQIQSLEKQCADTQADAKRKVLSLCSTLPVPRVLRHPRRHRCVESLLNVCLYLCLGCVSASKRTRTGCPRP